MPEESPLLQKINEVVGRVRTVEREKEECFARISTLEREKEEHLTRISGLEREVNEFRALIALAESKAEELLQPSEQRQQRAYENGQSSTSGKGLQDLVGRTTSREPQADGKRPFQPF